ncbi:hypothetical protein SAMN02746095_02023 [Acidocella aminolytica 101 = DSM 11237]|nr:hypothetical protein SAMN02746095_02023 [Acidocella aminolytica 101 = DSM 11237]
MAKRAYFRISSCLAGMALLSACAAPGSQDSIASLPVSEQALKGSTPQVLAADFGPPMLRRVDGPAQVWLYHSPVCGLNVFLYPDSHGVPRVAAVVPDNGANPQSCMQSLARPTTAAALERSASS